MTAAFLDSERALADIDSAVGVASELDPRSTLRTAWSALRERYGQVTDSYLRLSAAASVHDDARSAPPPQPGELTTCTDALSAMTEEMGRFARAHQRELDRARHAAGELTVLDQRARVAVTDARTALTQAPPTVARLSGVSAAADGLTTATAAFEHATGVPARRSAATTLITAAGRLQAALADAPQLGDRADRVIRSVDTRRGALDTRSAAVPGTLSALRREFSAACSADLADAESRIRTHLHAADEHLTDAKSTAADAPDQAIVAAEAAREDLDAAEGALDAVTDRLRLLREVRADPSATEGRVRFRLRDAQLFAMNNGLVDEWGSVLDAQADRISRAHSVLDGVHPDYWTFLTQLRAVEQRIVEIVERMRGQVAAR